MEDIDYTRFVLAFGFVVALIWLVAFGAKKLGLDKKMRGVTGNAKTRLRLLETLYLDPRRKVALVRADNKEYLILLGQESAQLIDTLEVHDAV